MLSDNEAAVAYQAEWSAAVVDIREQFPLPRAETRAIAAGMGVCHPRDRSVDVVMTTDFLLDVTGVDPWLSFELPQGVGRRLAAIAVKPDDVFGSPRALDKLEIERRYWVSKGVHWQLVLSSQLCRERLLKLQWLYEWYWLDHMPESRRPGFLSGCASVLAALADAGPERASDFLGRLDLRHSWEEGTALSMMRHLAARKRVWVDTDVRYDPWGPVSQFRLPAEIGREARAA